MYFHLDDPLNTIVVFLYTFVPAFLPLVPGLAIALLAAEK